MYVTSNNFEVTNYLSFAFTYFFRITYKHLAYVWFSINVYFTFLVDFVFSGGNLRRDNIFHLVFTIYFKISHYIDIKTRRSSQSLNFIFSAYLLNYNIQVHTDVF